MKIIFVIFFSLFACSHSKVKKAYQNPNCLDNSIDNSNNKDLIQYYEIIRKDIDPLLNKAIKNGFQRLENKNITLEIESPNKQISALIEITVDNHGKVIKWASTCIFNIAEIDESISFFLGELKQLDAPPSSVLNKEKTVKIPWIFKLENQNKI